VNGKGALGLILELTAVTRTFAGRCVLGPLDLELRGGERLALTGPNGSGKSTLLRCIGGTVAPSSGRIAVDGASAGTRAARHRVGASFSQERSFYLRLTGRENLHTFACLREPWAQAGRRVDELVAELGLEEIAAMRVDRCSTGMVQQLALARSLLGAPGLLLLDEPTRSLDDEAVERLWAALGRRPSLALIVATHRHEDIERCERHLALKAG
jgi:ABC-type multidrug transport system ATPase subunit